jgi:hypothetical protein
MMIKRLTAMLASVLVITACGSLPFGSAGAKDVAVRPGDFPGLALQACSSSGDVDAFIKAESTAGGTTKEDEESWRKAKELGASGSWVQMLAADAEQCATLIGDNGAFKVSGPWAVSYVLKFKDEAGARQAYQTGLFLPLGTPPATSEGPVLVGVATGLGPNAYVGDLFGIHFAAWQNKQFYVAEASGQMRATDNEKGASNVQARIR